MPLQLPLITRTTFRSLTLLIGPARPQASKKVTDASKVVEATAAGNAAIDALNQINEYFDSSDKSLQVPYILISVI